MDEITRKWAEWAEAAEEYAQAACSREKLAASEKQVEDRLRSAVERLGCDPCGVLEGGPS